MGDAGGELQSQASLSRRTLLLESGKILLGGAAAYGTKKTADIVVPFIVEEGSRSTQLHEGFLEDLRDSDTRLSAFALTLATIPSVSTLPQEWNPRTYGKENNAAVINLALSPKTGSQHINMAASRKLYHLDFEGMHLRASITDEGPNYGLQTLHLLSVDPRKRPIQGARLQDLQIHPDYSVRVGTMSASLVEYKPGEHIAFRASGIANGPRFDGFTDLPSFMQEQYNHRTLTQPPLAPYDFMVVIDLKSATGTASHDEEYDTFIRGHRILVGNYTDVVKAFAAGRTAESMFHLEIPDYEEAEQRALQEGTLINEQISRQTMLVLKDIDSQTRSQEGHPFSAAIWEQICEANGITWQGNKATRKNNAPSPIMSAQTIQANYSLRVDDPSDDYIDQWLNWAYVDQHAVSHEQGRRRYSPQGKPEVDPYSLVSVKQFEEKLGSRHWHARSVTSSVKKP